MKWNTSVGVSIIWCPLHDGHWMCGICAIAIYTQLNPELQWKFTDTEKMTRERKRECILYTGNSCVCWMVLVGVLVSSYDGSSVRYRSWKMSSQNNNNKQTTWILNNNNHHHNKNLRFIGLCNECLHECEGFVFVCGLETVVVYYYYYCGCCCCRP